jgi:hypothetical protein
MHRHWREFGPPTYVAVALYLGLNKPRREDHGLDDPEHLARFLAGLPGVQRSGMDQD